MTEIDEFKAKLRGEVESAMERIREMQDQAAEQYREMQANYAIFLDLSHRIQEAIRPWVEAFAESLPDVTPVVTERDFGPAGRVFLLITDFGEGTGCSGESGGSSAMLMTLTIIRGELQPGGRHAGGRAPDQGRPGTENDLPLLLATGV